jgi:hypothetical protein
MCVVGADNPLCAATALPLTPGASTTFCAQVCADMARQAAVLRSLGIAPVAFPQFLWEWLVERFGLKSLAHEFRKKLRQFVRGYRSISDFCNTFGRLAHLLVRLRVCVWCVYCAVVRVRARRRLRRPRAVQVPTCSMC